MNLTDKTNAALLHCASFQEAKQILAGNDDFKDGNGQTWRDMGESLFHPQCGVSEYLKIYDPAKAEWLNGELKVIAHDGE